MGFSIGIFTSGVIFGKQNQKKVHNKKTKYVGTLKVFDTDDIPELYLALEVHPNTLVDLADVILKVDRVSQFIS